jgi:nucleoside 2-deoxyribosyltransferase
MTKFKDDFDKGNEWRVYMKSYLEFDNTQTDVYVTNPNDFYSFKENAPSYDSELEIMDFDLNRLRNSDLVIVNYNDMQSLGSMAEIAIAYERRIPIIGLNEAGTELHPWQVCMTSKMFSDIDELLDYVENFYLR